MTGEQFTDRETLERMLLIARGAEEGEDVLDALIDMREPLEAALAKDAPTAAPSEPSSLEARYREAIETLRIAYIHMHRWTGTSGPHCPEFAERMVGLIEAEDGMRGDCLPLLAKGPKPLPRQSANLRRPPAAAQITTKGGR